MSGNTDCGIDFDLGFLKEKMKLKLFSSFILFLSAYSPLLLILTINDFDFKCKLEFRNLTLVIVLSSIVILSITILLVIFRQMPKGSSIGKIKKNENRSLDLINYTIPYIISFVSFNLNELNNIISLGFFMILLFVMTHKSSNVFVNPILLIFNYKMYDIEYESNGMTYSHSVLSKLDLNLNDYYYFKSITPFLFLIKNKYNDESGNIESVKSN